MKTMVTPGNLLKLVQTCTHFIQMYGSIYSDASAKMVIY